MCSDRLVQHPHDEVLRNGLFDARQLTLPGRPPLKSCCSCSILFSHRLSRILAAVYPRRGVLNQLLAKPGEHAEARRRSTSAR